MQHYTYVHRKPDGSIFYIGKGSGDRAYRKNHRNQYWKNIVAKHGSYSVDVLANWETHKEAIDHEILLISWFRKMGYELANLTDGGEGVVGYKPTQETLAKLSAKLKGKPSWAKGKKLKPHTEETKRLMSIAHKGKAITVEHKLNISIAKKGKANSRKGCKLSESHANKMREILKVARSNVDQSKIILPKATCLICKKTGTYNGMSRWHFNNCKER